MVQAVGALLKSPNTNVRKRKNESFYCDMLNTRYPTVFLYLSCDEESMCLHTSRLSIQQC
jgi:hypothetical protein